MKTWTRLHPTAKKTHRCELCGRTIQPGETYLRGSGFGDGEAHTWKECAHCEALADLITTRWGETEYSFETLAEWDEPKTVAEARVRAQWKRKWTNRAGDLYPLPNLVVIDDKDGLGWPRTIKPGERAA